jgi:hypothetical protein
MIKKAFDENGIKFAFPTVQVAGEGETSAATAAVAQRALELAKPAAAQPICSSGRAAGLERCPAVTGMCFFRASAKSE